MKSRAFLMGVMAVVSLTSGCACWNNPCWGFRLHPHANCGGGCGACCSPAPACCPAYSSPVSVAAPGGYPAPSFATGGPDCPSCGGGVSMAPPLAGYPTGQPGFPTASFPTIVGNPMPLPGNVVPSVMPGKN